MARLHLASERLIVRYDRSHKERSQKRLLHAAAAALRSEGPIRMSVPAIMGKLGQTHGGFYGHFASKADLVRKSIDFMFAETRHWWTDNEENLSPIEAIEAYVDRYLLSQHVCCPERGCPLPALAGDVGRLDDQTRHTFAAGVAWLHDAFAKQFAALGLDQDRAAEEASSLLAEMTGAIALARAMDTVAKADTLRERSKTAIKRRLRALAGQAAHPNGLA